MRQGSVNASIHERSAVRIAGSRQPVVTDDFSALWHKDATLCKDKELKKKKNNANSLITEMD